MERLNFTSAHARKRDFRWTLAQTNGISLSSNIFLGRWETDTHADIISCVCMFNDMRRALMHIAPIWTYAHTRVNAHKCVTHTSPVVRAPQLNIHTMSQQRVQLEKITPRLLWQRNCAPSFAFQLRIRGDLLDSMCISLRCIINYFWYLFQTFL